MRCIASNMHWPLAECLLVAYSLSELAYSWQHFCKLAVTDRYRAKCHTNAIVQVQTNHYPLNHTTENAIMSAVLSFVVGVVLATNSRQIEEMG